MRELISNVFTIQCFENAFYDATKQEDRIAGKWKNLIGSYPLFVKRYYVKEEGNLLTSQKICVTIGGMYFFWFLNALSQHKSLKTDISALKGLLENEQGIEQLEDIFFYGDTGFSAVFRDISVIRGSAEGLISTKPFNEALVRLIETYQIIPVKTTEDGYIWDTVTNQRELDGLEKIMVEYSGWLDYLNESKR